MQLSTTQYGPITKFTLTPTFAGRPLFKVCSYLVDGLLIDTGYPHAARAFAAYCDRFRVEQIVNTHYHEDHVGGNHAFQLRRGIVPQIHQRSVARLAEAYSPLNFYEQVLWGTPKLAPARALGDYVETNRYKFRVIEVPGHSNDQICLFEENEGWVFTGDLFLAERVRVARQDENIVTLMDSARRVAELDSGQLFCAHGRVVEQPQAALNRKVEFWEDLQFKACSRYSAGQDLRRIRRDLLGREGFFKLLTRGHFSKQNLINALVLPSPV